MAFCTAQNQRPTLLQDGAPGFFIETSGYSANTFDLHVEHVVSRQARDGDDTGASAPYVVAQRKLSGIVVKHDGFGVELVVASRRLKEDFLSSALLRFEVQAGTNRLGETSGINSQ